MIDVRVASTAADNQRFDAIAFRELVCSRPQVTFDELDTSPKHVAVNFEADLDAMLAGGWHRHGQHLQSLSPPLPWNEFDRSFSFHIHAWEPLSFLLKGSCTAKSAEKREQYYRVSRAFALDWIEHFQQPAYAVGPEVAVSAIWAEKSGFAWYDMAVGQRIYRLAFILDQECRSANPDNAVIEAVYHSLCFHNDALTVESFFRAHSNHGLYQALGQVAACKRFVDIDQSFESPYRLASSRLAHVLDVHFTKDNVHKEHSPGYHWMILGSLIGAQQTDLVANLETRARLVEMEKVLACMVKPNSCLATIGDTDPRLMAREPKFPRTGPPTSFILASRFKTQELQAIQTQGHLGHYPASGVKAYHDAGYAFARLYAYDVEPVFTNASYLAQIAGFHSRVHKHADHLSFIWYDRNRDVLIDPARYAYSGKTTPGSPLFEDGFWYSDPKRIYCETTRAHNCVEIDGRSYQRNKVKPWGSALIYAGEQGGFAVTDCAVTHFRNVRHRRHLIMRAGHFLLVLDWLHDRSGIVHDYRQWFHFDHSWLVETDGCLIRARHPGADDSPPLDLTASSLVSGPTLGPVVRGQERPELLGWQSDKPYSLIPSSCFRHEVRGAGPTIFATLFTFGKKLEVDPRATRFNASMKMGRAVWTDERGQHRIEIERSDDGRLTVREAPT